MEGFGSLVNSVVISVIGSVLALSGSLVLFLLNRSSKRADAAAREYEAVKARLAATELQLALIGQTVTPIYTVIQQMLARELTHSHKPEMDALLLKAMSPVIMTTAEEKRLRILLEETTKDMDPRISERERGAAAIFPEVRERAKAEQRGVAQNSKTLISVVSVVDVPGMTVGTGDDKP